MVSRSLVQTSTPWSVYLLKAVTNKLQFWYAGTSSEYLGQVRISKSSCQGRGWHSILFILPILHDCIAFVCCVLTTCKPNTDTLLTRDLDRFRFRFRFRFISVVARRLKITPKHDYVTFGSLLSQIRLFVCLPSVACL